MYGDLGFDFLQTLKEAAAVGLTAAKQDILARGGAAIAASPEGQQAIRQTVRSTVRAKVESAASSAGDFLARVPLPVWLGLGALVVVRLRRRR